jgi:CBS domain containing-hemolysin-like protein
MEDAIHALTSISLVLLLVIANGFFVAVEFALLRSHAPKLKSAELKDRFGLKATLRLLDEIDFTLAATQVGITIASLVLGWWGESTFQKMFEPLFLSLEIPAVTAISHGVATVLALVLVTALHVVLGEVLAKSLALRYPEECILKLAPMMLAFQIIFSPIISLLNNTASLLLRLVGITREPELERVHSSAELAQLVSHSTVQGVLDKSEEEMLHGVINFAETVAREIMTPRTDLISISVDCSLEHVVDQLVKSGFSRFPVTGENVDDVVGILLARDLLPVLFTLKNQNIRDFSVKKIMREPYFVPGTKPIDDLLSEFKKRKIHIAVVLDEHGGVDGIVTLEDVIEEIVGDIFDESDVQERDIVVHENGDVIVDGGVLVADINKELELDIPEGDYDTIAGFVYTSLGRLPRTGDTVPITPELDDHSEKSNGEDHTESNSSANTHLIVEKVRGRRIEKVRLHKPISSATTSSSAASDRQ